MNPARIWIDQAGVQEELTRKVQEYSSVTKKVSFWKIYSKIVIYKVNNKKNNKNVNKNVKNNDSRSNRSIRRNRFQLEEYKQ